MRLLIKLLNEYVVNAIDNLIFFKYYYYLFYFQAYKWCIAAMKEITVGLPVKVVVDVLRQASKVTFQITLCFVIQLSTEEKRKPHTQTDPNANPSITVAGYLKSF